MSEYPDASMSGGVPIRRSGRERKVDGDPGAVMKDDGNEHLLQFLKCSYRKTEIS